MSLNVYASNNQNSERSINYFFSISPFAYSLFGYDYTYINNSSGLKDQIIDIPLKRLVMGIYFDNKKEQTEIKVQVTFNRFNDSTLPDYKQIDDQYNKSRITTTQCGLTHRGYSKQSGYGFFQELSIGFAFIDVYRGNFDKTHTAKPGTSGYMQYGLGYSFKAESSHQVDVGFDLLIIGRALHKTEDNRYHNLSMLGIYPYVGIMW